MYILTTTKDSSTSVCTPRLKLMFTYYFVIQVSFFKKTKGYDEVLDLKYHVHNYESEDETTSE